MNSIVRFLHLDVIFSQRCQYTNPFTVDWIAVTIVYTCTYSKHRTADGEATLIAYGNAGRTQGYFRYDKSSSTDNKNTAIPPVFDDITKISHSLGLRLISSELSRHIRWTACDRYDANVRNSVRLRKERSNDSWSISFEISYRRSE